MQSGRYRFLLKINGATEAFGPLLAPLLSTPSGDFRGGKLHLLKIKISTNLASSTQLSSPLSRISHPKMSQILNEVLSANQRYAATFGEKAKLSIPPARHFAVLTCMDARLDPAKFAGLAEGDAHVIRNAGGRASEDAIRSLVISYKLLGTHEWFVIHHTDCGMELFTNETMPANCSRRAWKQRG